MGRPPRAVREAYDADALTDIAMQVFAERGYDGASLEDVATAAGIKKSSIYHHVSGKENLLARGLGRGLAGLFSLLEEEEATTGPALDCLRFIVAGAAEGLLADVAGVKVLLSLRGMTPTEQWARGRRIEFNRRLTELMRRAVREGDVRDDIDPDLLTLLVFGMLASVTEWYDPAIHVDADSIADAVLAVADTGISRR